jgi:hypothetical protein
MACAGNVREVGVKVTAGAAASAPVTRTPSVTSEIATTDSHR